MAKSVVRTELDGEHFVHKVLWTVVDRQLASSAQFKLGSLYDDMIAMVFAFHAFEAYLNYVGEHLASEIWKDERNAFRNEPYRGFDGKVRRVLELAGVAEPDRCTRPYSTVWLLKDLRDLVAHGRVERGKVIVDHPEDETPWMSSQLEKLVTRDAALNSRDDIEAVARMIHEAAAPKIRDVWFGRDPFGGVSHHAERSTIAT